MRSGARLAFVAVMASASACAALLGDFDDKGSATGGSATGGASSSSTGSDAGSCDSPLARCDGICTNTSLDSANCGACGHACGAGQPCMGGVCSCMPPSMLCGSPPQCNDIEGDSQNCGGCGIVCSNGETCQGGACKPAGTSDGGPMCPNETGAYSIAASGQGCQDLDATATQCIKLGPDCKLELASMGATSAGVDGSAQADQNGDFANASLQLGSTLRTACTGSWTAATSQLVVDCGGMGNSQSCVVTLTRTASICPF